MSGNPLGVDLWSLESGTAPNNTNRVTGDGARTDPPNLTQSPNALAPLAMFLNQTGWRNLAMLRLRLLVG
jgi:hypothetical protein